MRVWVGGQYRIAQQASRSCGEVCIIYNLKEQYGEDQC
jgi:hypothetical protein